MKTKYIIASLGTATLLSFGANAAVHQSTRNRRRICNRWAPFPSRRLAVRQWICARIVAKAEKAGANSYRIIELKEGDNWHATAELYK